MSGAARNLRSAVVAAARSNAYSRLRQSATHGQRSSRSNTTSDHVVTTSLAGGATTAGVATATFFLHNQNENTAYSPENENVPLDGENSPAYATSRILCDVARGDPESIQSLLALISDSSQLESLLRSGALEALLDGIRSTGSGPSAVRLALVRAIADFIEGTTSEIIQTVIPSQLGDTLTNLLTTAAEHVEESWFAWLYRLTGLQSTQHSNQNDLLSGEAYHTARVVAALTRNTDLHEKLLEHPKFLPALCRALRSHAALTSTLPEHNGARQSFLASVSALAKSASHQLVDASTHTLLLRYASDPSEPVLQMYATAGLRNLSRHPSHREQETWRVHRELVVNGLPNALREALTAKTAQTRAFAAAALADVLTTGHPKANIIQDRLEPTFAPFAKLLVDRDPTVSRAMAKALHAVSTTGSKSSDGTVTPHCLRPQLSSALVAQCGPFVNGPVANGEIASMSVARVLCVSKYVATGMVDKGLLEVILNCVKQSSGRIREEGVKILAALVEWPDLAKLATQRGALRQILLKPCLDNNAKSSAAFLARMARDPSNCVDIGHSGIPVILAAVTARNNPEAAVEGARALFNLSLDGVSKVMISIHGGLIPLVQLAGGSDPEGRRIAIATLAELSEAMELATKLVEANVLKTLLTSVACDPSLTRDVARCLAQLSLVNDVHGAMASSGVASWLADLVKQNGGGGEHAAETMNYATVAVCNISCTPGTARNAIKDSGVSRTLSVLIASGMGAPLVVHSARQAMRNLRGEEGVTMLPVEGIAKSPTPL